MQDSFAMALWEWGMVGSVCKVSRVVDIRTERVHNGISEPWVVCLWWSAVPTAREVHIFIKEITNKYALSIQSLKSSFSTGLFLDDSCHERPSVMVPPIGTTFKWTWTILLFHLILSYLIISDFKLWGDPPWGLTYLMPFTISQTRVCLMVNLVLLNLNLFWTVHFHAMHGYTATHMHITHVLCFSSILPPPCGCTMLLISVMLALDSIGRFTINMYIHYDNI